MRSVSYLRCAYIQRVTRIDIVISITPQDSSFYVCSHKSVDRDKRFSPIHIYSAFINRNGNMIEYEDAFYCAKHYNDKTWCLTLIVITYHVVKYSKLLWNIIM